MDWHHSHDGSPHTYGYERDRLVGQVAFYDDVGGEGAGFVGFVHGHRVTGRCSTAAEAQASVAATPVREGASGSPRG